MNGSCPLLPTSAYIKLLSILVFSTRLITGFCHGEGLSLGTYCTIYWSLLSSSVLLDFGAIVNHVCSSKLSRAGSTVTQTKVEAND